MLFCNYSTNWCYTYFQLEEPRKQNKRQTCSRIKCMGGTANHTWFSRRRNQMAESVKYFRRRT